MIMTAIQWLLDFLAAPTVGLTSVFFISLVSATLIPMGSEPAVFAVIKANADLYWPVLLVATVGNTLGGMINYALGYGAKQVFARERKTRWFHWLERYGAKTLLLSWLPGIGDPICSVAGWLRLPFWPCVAYMAIGKFLRYLALTTVLLHVPDESWRWLLNLF
ncbi:YqaA family protein [Noviherbaspirillum pedocola]|uniref:DedA family protein n=1 Tax=Noviherbaspirillum pedocola TaxID=2801341 RepID=A0A934W7K4_9BURK|nr:YqaA family protein [Noviherbaspirillum pedocola]MBK4734784.1 DedA family protein [Noviherbaspirillum pedocola]